MPFLKHHEIPSSTEEQQPGQWHLTAHRVCQGSSGQCPVISLDVTSRACGPCWLLTRAQGSALMTGRNGQAAWAAAGQCWPQFLLPTAPGAIGMGLTHIWDCAKGNELLPGHFCRRWYREVVQPCWARCPLLSLAPYGQGSRSCEFLAGRVLKSSSQLLLPNTCPCNRGVYPLLE